MKKTDSKHANNHHATLSFWFAAGIIVVSTFVLGSSVALAQSGQDAVEGNGTRLQGTRLQGTRLQGTRLQGELLSSGLAASAFVATLADGRAVEIQGFRGNEVDATVWLPDATQASSVVLHAQELIGMTWYAPLCIYDGQTICLDSWYRIAAGGTDPNTNTMPDHSSNSDVWLYQVEYTLDLAVGAWHGVCEVDVDGSSSGVFVNGTWEADGEWNSVGYTYSCSAGVIAKCSQGWGYKPWLSLPAKDGSMVDLQPLHQACTRAARADYCGDGVTHTVDGLLVDIFDIYDFNVNEHVRGFSEEASFDTYGAASLKHRRVVNHPNHVSCQLPRRAPADETPLLSVWSRPTTILPDRN